MHGLGPGHVDRLQGSRRDHRIDDTFALAVSVSTVLRHLSGVHGADLRQCL